MCIIELSGQDLQKFLLDCRKRVEERERKEKEE